MIRPRPSISLYCTASFLLITLTLAASASAADSLTWLYPPQSAQDLTFNTLDTLNVSWISTLTPAFLTLSCNSNNDEVNTPTLQLPVPATGNRLVSLSSLPSSSQTCHFALSSPTNFTSATDPSPSFILTNKADQAPAFWTLDHAAAGSTFEQQKSQADQSKCKSKDTSTSAMAAIGVGVAVGVFALTTAMYVLYEIQRRKRRAVEAEEEREGEGDARTKKWVAKTLRSADSSIEMEAGRGGRGHGQQGHELGGLSPPPPPPPEVGELSGSREG